MVASIALGRGDKGLFRRSRALGGSHYAEARDPSAHRSTAPPNRSAVQRPKAAGLPQQRAGSAPARRQLRAAICRVIGRSPIGSSLVGNYGDTVTVIPIVRPKCKDGILVIGAHARATASFACLDVYGCVSMREMECDCHSLPSI